MCGDCCVCEPCCGSPCSIKDGLYCFICWTFCFECSVSKLWASSMGHHRWGFVNHLLPWLVCLLLLSAYIGLHSDSQWFMWNEFNNGPIDLTAPYPFLSTEPQNDGGFSPASIYWMLSMCATIAAFMFLFLRYYLSTLIRLNLRRRFMIAGSECHCSDCCFGAFICTSPCSLCQELRSVSVEDWDWLAAVQESRAGMMTEQFTLWPRQQLGELANQCKDVSVSAVPAESCDAKQLNDVDPVEMELDEVV